jgi:glycosyltransferase involved in cell wall biosynthesis
MTFVFVGRDYLHGELMRQAAAQCPNVDVRFVGPREDIPMWCQAADLYVQPSLWEGSSNALLEAMSCGLPVIATEVGGNCDAVQDEKTGLLAPPGDAPALAQAIHKLWQDMPRRNCLGRAAREHAVQCHRLPVTLRACTNRYKALAASLPSADSGAFV